MLNQTTNNRILLIVDTTFGQTGGTELNTLNFAQALITKNYNPIIVEVGLRFLVESNLGKGVEFYHIETKHFDSVELKPWLQLIKKTNPAVIIRSKPWAERINWKLDLAALFSNAAYLDWEHHPYAHPQFESSTNINALKRIKVRIKNLLRNKLHIKSVKRTLAVSNAVKTPFVELFPEAKLTTDLIYPGVNFDLFQHSSDDRKMLRAQWGIPESAFVVGSLGRLVPHKGNDFSLKVFAEISKKQPDANIYCVFAGKGPDQERLEELAIELGVSERVKFPGWQESAPAAWSAIDVFLMPSADEGLGMTLIEAVACRCIVLAAAVGGMTEILAESLAQYSLPPLDIKTWVDATQQLLNCTPDKRISIQSNMYAALYKRFEATQQWCAMVEWMEQHSNLN